VPVRFECVLCREEGASTAARPLGLVSLIQRSRLLALQAECVARAFGQRGRV
jgi:hypothetical protein